MTVLFSASPDSGEAFVAYEGKVFEAGEYPDKEFAISEEELDERIGGFDGVDLDLEHSEFRDLLGHRLGRLEKMWRDGRDAFGRLSIPRWLHELSGGLLQTSLSFDRDKRIVGCALTLSPRIPDAHIAAAFSAASSTPFPADATADDRTKENHMTSFKDRLRVLFGKAPQALVEAGIDPGELDTVEFSDAQPAIAPAIQSQLAEFKATNDRLVSAQLAIAATLFADDTIRAAKAVPAQRDHLVSLYKSAALADGQGTVRFTENGLVAEGSNLKALHDLFKDAQPHSLFTTQIPNADPNADSAEPDPATVERLRNATSLGQLTRKKEGQ